MEEHPHEYAGLRITRDPDTTEVTQPDPSDAPADDAP